MGKINIYVAIHQSSFYSKRDLKKKKKKTSVQRKEVKEKKEGRVSLDCEQRFLKKYKKRFRDIKERKGSRRRRAELFRNMRGRMLGGTPERKIRERERRNRREHSLLGDQIPMRKKYIKAQTHIKGEKRIQKKRREGRARERKEIRKRSSRREDSVSKEECV